MLCGCPLYEYHHMEPFAEVREHQAENLTLLCDNHHKKATNALLTREEIETADKSPFNVAHGVSSPFGINFHGPQFEVVIGGNRFSGGLRTSEDWLVTAPITVDDMDLLWFKSDPSGHVFLHANIFDEFNLPMLQIFENSIVYRTEVWDIEFIGHTLSIREAARKFLVEITFEPPNRIVIDRARLLCNGVEIVVRKSHIFIVNSENIIVDTTMTDCIAGIQIGRNDRGFSSAFAQNPTAVSRYQLSRLDARKREIEAIARLKEILESSGKSYDFVNPA